MLRDMDPLVQVAIVSGVVAVIVAWLSRPTFTSHRRLKRIEGQFENNGGSTARDSLDRIEHGVSHLTGRFDQHIEDSKNDKELAHKEAVRMWGAIEAIAKSTPAQGDHNG